MCLQTDFPEEILIFRIIQEMYWRLYDGEMIYIIIHNNSIA